MTSTAQAYEWVKTGHWSLRHFREWFDAQQRTWVGLTDEEFNYITKESFSYQDAIDMTQAKLKEKNT
jgi:hypothetical protein